MAEIKADNNPIIVDKENGETSGESQIKYSKEQFDELWERTNGGAWSQINVHVRTGKGDEADFDGKYRIALKPGEFYEVCIFRDGQGPTSTDPIQVACVKVFCLWKNPEVRDLINDQNRAFGGTWYAHQVATSVPTNIVTIGVSRQQPVLDNNGIPRFLETDGAPTTPLTIAKIHRVELKPLFPGNHYFFVVVVADAFGNWDVRQEEFTTLRRKITVEFPTIHIFNDGDAHSEGEAEFIFRVFKGHHTQPEVIQDFHLPTQDVDGGTQMPLGFAHLGSFEVVMPGKQDVGVASWGTEHDGWFLDSDAADYASNFGVPLQLPSGRFVESISNVFFTMDCPASSDGSSFHYGVDVRWSVEYGI